MERPCFLVGFMSIAIVDVIGWRNQMQLPEQEMVVSVYQLITNILLITAN